MLEQRRTTGRRSAAERADPRDELREAEGLGEVIVRAHGEPLDQILDLTGSGEHDDAGLRTFRPHQPAYIVAVHLG